MRSLNLSSPGVLNWPVLRSSLLRSLILVLAFAVGGVIAASPGATPTLAAPASERPAWLDLPLADARTGETFTLGSFVGKTVYVEPMATWCTNCRQQLGVVRDVHAQLDPDRYVFVGLSVETDLPSEELARYADAQGWPWTFAVMSPELLQQLSATYGLTIGNPPSTPHFIIGPDGTTSELSTGIHPAPEILTDLAPG